MFKQSNYLLKQTSINSKFYILQFIMSKVQSNPNVANAVNVANVTPNVAKLNTSDFVDLLQNDSSAMSNEQLKVLVDQAILLTDICKLENTCPEQKLQINVCLNQLVMALVRSVNTTKYALNDQNLIGLGPVFYHNLSVSLFQLGQLEEGYYASLQAMNNFWPNVNETFLQAQMLNQSNVVENLKFKYENYDEKLVANFTKHIQSLSLKAKSQSDPKNEINEIDKISNVIVTMTSCKRLNLFQTTVNSFLKCCEDRHMIAKWICVDDNSSNEDRAQMQRLYPFIEFVWKTPEQKGHPQSCNMILERIESLPQEYVFHLEDDHTFIRLEHYLSKTIIVLNTLPTVGQCLINKNYGEGQETAKLVGGILRAINAAPHQFYCYEHEYVPDFETATSELKEKFEGKSNCAYWPHYSLRPGMLKKQVYQKVGKFNCEASHFEMEYAHRYVRAGFTTAFLDNIHALHTGRRTYERDNKDMTNAYELNQEKQFGENRQTVADKNKQIESAQELEQIDHETNVINLKTMAISNQQPKNQIDTNANIEPIKPSQQVLDKIGQIHVLNLKRRPDRLKNFKKVNKHIVDFANVKVEIAVDGMSLQLTPAIVKMFRTNDFGMRPGIVGCALSHINMWTKFLTSQDEYLIVIEDDAELCANFLNVLNDQLLQLDQLESWDILYLGIFLFDKQKQEEMKQTQTIYTIEAYNTDKLLQQSFGGTQSYVLSKSGAQKLLNHISELGVHNGIDILMYKTNLNFFVSEPHISFAPNIQENPNCDSDIQKNFDSHLCLNAVEVLQLHIDFWLDYFADYPISLLECETMDFGDIQSFTEKTDKVENSKIVFSSKLPNTNIVLSHVSFVKCQSKADRDFLLSKIHKMIKICKLEANNAFYLVLIPEPIANLSKICENIMFD